MVPLTAFFSLVLVSAFPPATGMFCDPAPGEKCLVDFPTIPNEGVVLLDSAVMDSDGVERYLVWPWKLYMWFDAFEWGLTLHPQCNGPCHPVGDPSCDGAVMSGYLGCSWNDSCVGFGCVNRWIAPVQLPPREHLEDLILLTLCGMGESVLAEFFYYRQFRPLLQVGDYVPGQAVGSAISINGSDLLANITAQAMRDCDRCYEFGEGCVEEGEPEGESGEGEGPPTRGITREPVREFPGGYPPNFPWCEDVIECDFTELGTSYDALRASMDQVESNARFPDGAVFEYVKKPGTNDVVLFVSSPIIIENPARMMSVSWAYPVYDQANPTSHVLVSCGYRWQCFDRISPSDSAPPEWLGSTAFFFCSQSSLFGGTIVSDVSKRGYKSDLMPNVQGEFEFRYVVPPSYDTTYLARVPEGERFNYIVRRVNSPTSFGPWGKFWYTSNTDTISSVREHGCPVYTDTLVLADVAGFEGALRNNALLEALTGVDGSGGFAGGGGLTVEQLEWLADQINRDSINRADVAIGVRDGVKGAASHLAGEFTKASAVRDYEVSQGASVAGNGLGAANAGQTAFQGTLGGVGTGDEGAGDGGTGAFGEAASVQPYENLEAFVSSFSAPGYEAGGSLVQVPMTLLGLAPMNLTATWNQPQAGNDNGNTWRINDLLGTLASLMRFLALFMLWIAYIRAWLRLVNFIVS